LNQIIKRKAAAKEKKNRERGGKGYLQGGKKVPSHCACKVKVKKGNAGQSCSGSEGEGTRSNSNEGIVKEEGTLRGKKN